MTATQENDIDLSLMEEVFEQYSEQQGALIPILQKAQNTYGWLPGEVLELIGDRLGMSPGQVYGVATFYAQFYLEERGRHILKLCDGTACHVRGTPILVTAMEDGMNIRPGETSEDGELTMEIVYCLGSCALAPVVVLDEQVMGRMRPQMIVRRVERHIASAKKAQEA